MPTPPIYPSIPVPKEDLKSLNESVLALKQAVEQLIAHHPVSVQMDEPALQNVGDLWIQPGTGRMSYYSGLQWVMLTGGVAGFGAMAVDGQAIPTVPTKVALVVPPVFNRGEMFNSDTQRFVPRVGMVQFNMQLQTVLNVGNAVVNVGVYLNGTRIGLSSASGNNGQLVTATLSFSTLRHSTGDYYEMYIWATSGGMTVVGAGTGFGAWGVGIGGVVDAASEAGLMELGLSRFYRAQRK